MNLNSVSIITIAYNSSKTIGALLNSIYTNREYVREVILIDNNSADQELVREICEQYKTKLELTFICSQNIGFGRSSNLGAKNSKGQYLLFLNPDTELRNNSLKVLLEHFTTHIADIMGGKALSSENRVHGTVVRKPTLFIGLFEFSNLGKLSHTNLAHRLFYYEDLQVLSSEQDKEVDVVSGAYMLVSKESFTKLGGFDENIFMYLEDVDLCVRAKNLGLKVMFCPHSIIRHIGGASSQNKYKINHQAWFSSRKYYFNKHFRLLTNIIIQPIYTIEEFVLKISRNL